MHVISVTDLSQQDALRAASRIRRVTGHWSKSDADEQENLSKSVSLVGGRLSFLNRVSKSKDVVQMAEHMMEVEKAWILSQIGMVWFDLD